MEPMSDMVTAAWRNGGLLPDNDAMLMRILKMRTKNTQDCTRWQKMKPRILSEPWQLKEGYWVLPWMEREWESVTGHLPIEGLKRKTFENGGDTLENNGAIVKNNGATVKNIGDTFENNGECLSGNSLKNNNVGTQTQIQTQSQKTEKDNKDTEAKMALPNHDCGNRVNGGDNLTTHDCHDKVNVRDTDGSGNGHDNPTVDGPDGYGGGLPIPTPESNDDSSDYWHCPVSGNDDYELGPLYDYQPDDHVAQADITGQILYDMDRLFTALDMAPVVHLPAVIDQTRRFLDTGKPAELQKLSRKQPSRIGQMNFCENVVEGHERKTGDIDNLQYYLFNLVHIKKDVSPRFCR
jgi:hypothetical protein